MPADGVIEVGGIAILPDPHKVSQALGGLLILLNIRA